MPLKDSYLKLITSQHRDKQKYMAMVEAVLDPFDGVFNLLTYFDDEFDLDLAAGAQQDALGKIVGQSRELNFKYDKNASSILDDEAYRVIQKAKILRNMWDGQIGDLYEKWLILFGAPIKVKDNQDMTMSVLLDIDESGEMQKLMKLAAHGLIVPKPMGVGINFDFRYPPINMPVEIQHSAKSMQYVRANHCAWNLGEARSTYWDDEFCLDDTIRFDGIYPNELYRERQLHTVKMTSLSNTYMPVQITHNPKIMLQTGMLQPIAITHTNKATNQVSSTQKVQVKHITEATPKVHIEQTTSCRYINMFDDSFCFDDSHFFNDRQENTEMISHACTVRTLTKDGTEGEREII